MPGVLLARAGSEGKVCRDAPQRHEVIDEVRGQEEGQHGGRQAVCDPDPASGMHLRRPRVVARLDAVAARNVTWPQANLGIRRPAAPSPTQVQVSHRPGADLGSGLAGTRATPRQPRGLLRLSQWRRPHPHKLFIQRPGAFGPGQEELLRLRADGAPPRCPRGFRRCNSIGCSGPGVPTTQTGKLHRSKKPRPWISQAERVLEQGTHFRLGYCAALQPGIRPLKRRPPFDEFLRRHHAAIEPDEFIARYGQQKGSSF